MSERGENDSREIGSSDKFLATAVRRNAVNHQTRLCQRFQRKEDVTRQPVSGRPRVKTSRQDRYLVLSARRQTGSTARVLGLSLTVATRIRISRQTVYRRLNHAGLYSRRPAVCIPLTSANKRSHLNWKLKYQHWSVGEWANVMFSDESRLSLSSDSWRGRNGVGGIMMDGRTDLHFFDTGSVTDQRYRDEVHEPYVRFFRSAVGPEFIFMDNNAPCHRVVLIDDFLETENIQRMSWPANSPDLNHIEHERDILGRQIAVLLHPPSSVSELKTALQ
ncbi:transposable element Tcb2 transposase [Trichonephila clavipes]|nr:transposable element Tcb2 transposase [Trichonephila clavipes]